MRLSDGSLLNPSHLRTFLSCLCSPKNSGELLYLFFIASPETRKVWLLFGVFTLCQLFCSCSFLCDQNALPHCQNHFPFLYVILSWWWGNQWESYPWNELGETPLKKWVKMSAAVVNTGQSVGKYQKFFLTSVYYDSMLTGEFVSYLSRMNLYNLGGGTRLEETYPDQSEASIYLAWIDKGLVIEATGCLYCSCQVVLFWFKQCQRKNLVVKRKRKKRSFVIRLINRTSWAR